MFYSPLKKKTKKNNAVGQIFILSAFKVFIRFLSTQKEKQTFTFFDIVCCIHLGKINNYTCKIIYENKSKRADGDCEQTLNTQ